MKSKEELFKVGARYAVFGQGLLEVIDEMRDTPMYRQKIKTLINNLTKELEKDIHISDVFLEGQDIVTDISNDVDSVLEDKLNEFLNRLKL